MKRAALLAPLFLATVLSPVLGWSGPVPARAAPAAAPLQIAAAPPPLTSGDAQAIKEALASAPSRGLPAIAIGEAARPALGVPPDPDQSLATAAIAYASAEQGLIADPRKIDPNFAMRPARDLAAEFAAARDTGHATAWMTAQAHVNPDFLRLAKARDSYASIVAAGGWPMLSRGEVLKLGVRDDRVVLLRQRLAIEGYVAAPPAPLDPTVLTEFDPPLAAALASFQDHHGLKADGVLSSATIDALNVPAATRLSAIEANLERARWLPSQLPADRIEVDIGAPDASLYQAGAQVLTMRAIVGRPDRKTPTFASTVTAVKFNPPWIVPADIAARELFPKERRSPGYFARGGFVVEGGQVIQQPGPKASLGYVKFEMPDPFGVYLHDTPSRGLFAHAKRWLSHGCMRLEKPRELAVALLTAQGWGRESVDAAIAAGATRTVALKVQTPVFVVYRTVTVDGDGLASFRPDVYGWDAKVVAALAASRA
jgi:L,D-transpeptidase YcbB